MNDKQMKLYVRRIIEGLHLVYDAIEDTLSDSEPVREEWTERILKPEIQKVIEGRSKKNVLSFSGFNPEVLCAENYEDKVCFGEIIVLSPLLRYIEGLEEDLKSL